jgi:hypothetical protein
VCDEYTPAATVDRGRDTDFESAPKQGRWVCWDFQEMRVRPTHYTVSGGYLCTWIIETSMDGRRWMEVDRRTDDQNITEAWETASFAIASPAQCRLIRLTQIATNHDGDDTLHLFAVEFHGVLLEPAIPSPVPSASTGPQKFAPPVEFAFVREKCLDGIISYLTKKHGGNVHEKGIIRLSSNDSSHEVSLMSIADLTRHSYFPSRELPNQWICWDFHEFRICPAHYVLSDTGLKSWHVEGSVDGETWTEIDRRVDDERTDGDGPFAAFAVQRPMTCRFIRLTQTDTWTPEQPLLFLESVEFFGLVLES